MAKKNWLQVPWEQVPDLVAMRRVVVKAGFAFVNRRDMGMVIGSHFRVQLNRALSLTATRWVGHLAAEEAERVTPIVEGLSQR